MPEGSVRAAFGAAFVFLTTVVALVHERLHRIEAGDGWL